MGGSRCIFRDCTVSTTQNPNAHFFHFPVKDRERFMKWIEMSGAHDILNLPVSCQKNRVVCLRHFAADRFMNYKLNKLVQNAVPTLVRYGTKLALDYSRLDHRGRPAIVILNEKNKAKHLTPPDDFVCPMNFSEREIAEGQKLLDALQQCGMNEVYKLIKTDEECRKRTHMRLINEELELKRIKLSQQMIEAPEEKKFNNVEGYTFENDLQIIIEDSSDEYENNEEQMTDYMCVIESENITMNETIKQFTDVGIQVSADDMISITDHNHVISELQENYNDACSKIIIMEAKHEEDTKAIVEELKCKNYELAKLRVTMQKEREMLHLEIKQLHDEKQKIATDHKNISEKNVILENGNKLLQNKAIDLQLKCNSLELKLKEQEEKQNVQQQNSTVSTSKDSKVNNQQEKINTSQTPLNKAQLFNGIKKYLTTSMVTLLRMEMFGNAERAWKSDEKRTSVELLRLGETVYNYLTDEWRFRLPALRLVREWLKETPNDFDGEEEL